MRESGGLGGGTSGTGTVNEDWLCWRRQYGRCTGGAPCDGSPGVQDHSAEAVERMRSLGATAGTLTQIGEECQVVFLCLPTSAHVRQVVFGPGGLVRSLTPGTLIIDQTTGDPNETRKMAVELSARGIDLIDAPVSGGIAGAQAGTIAIMVGAEQAQFERAAPLLQTISPNIFHAGGIGNGHVIKQVNNYCRRRSASCRSKASCSPRRMASIQRSRRRFSWPAAPAMPISTG